MLSPSPASCTSPKPDTDSPDKKVHWASEKRRRTSSTDSESKTHLDVSKLPRSRRPSRLTVKYDRGHLQRWLEMEQWVDAQLQELFQVGSLRLPETMDPGRVPIFRGLAWRHLGELEGRCVMLSRSMLLQESLGCVFNPCVLWKRSFNIAWTPFLSYTRGSPCLMYLFAKTS